MNLRQCFQVSSTYSGIISPGRSGAGPSLLGFQPPKNNSYGQVEVQKWSHHSCSQGLCRPMCYRSRLLAVRGGSREGRGVARPLLWFGPPQEYTMGASTNFDAQLLSVILCPLA